MVITQLCTINNTKDKNALATSEIKVLQIWNLAERRSKLCKLSKVAEVHPLFPALVVTNTSSRFTRPSAKAADRAFPMPFSLPWIWMNTVH